MTRDEILAMPAGREMDALIAEKVMGWKHEMVSSHGRSNLLWHLPGGWSTGRHLEPRSYSTDISAAWEVVEKLAHVPNAWYIESLNIERAGKGLHTEWFVTYWNDEDLDVETFSEFLPLAICRAALLAVME